MIPFFEATVYAWVHDDRWIDPYYWHQMAAFMVIGFVVLFGGGLWLERRGY